MHTSFAAALYPRNASSTTSHPSFLAPSHVARASAAFFFSKPALLSPRRASASSHSLKVAATRRSRLALSMSLLIASVVPISSCRTHESSQSPSQLHRYSHPVSSPSSPPKHLGALLAAVIEATFQLPALHAST